ncbi:hypothetical protein G6F46_008126 [Rhizopus delemar]|uniref:SDE2-like domain-containing protein n=2 Tax=Rhizopus TaxID=4842 RepID=A0A9P6YZL8_9FUNG|nr:hypothetical protein G6F55_007053 [Rhizopus delemar]KAG1540609.1 hypothetical protein G6F51_008416 [Rhizopus arrhizus]KAG1508819.1 hypothetical protein G6F53_007901 [Rhizopus delemar]KAG1524417.1 hypothetical protein G6F52_004213 [Rhizopus delemar]KAG1550673.1 hypothetical protein G6F49_009218 [Rhizopus delemar]
MTQAIVSLLSSSSICLPIEEKTCTAHQLKQKIAQLTFIPVDQQVLSTVGGIALHDEQYLQVENNTLYFNLSARLLGGKGGFGSMLRAQGGRMNAQKTTNFEACRDLQGRRIRTVNEAKRMQEELEAIPEREAEKREKLKRKIEEALKEREPRKHLFDDNKFLEESEEMVEGVKSAVGQAIKRQKVVHKPVASTSNSLFDDEVSSEEEDDEDEEEEEEEEEEKEEKGKKEESTDKEEAVVLNRSKKDVKGKGKQKK